VKDAPEIKAMADASILNRDNGKRLFPASRQNAQIYARKSLADWDNIYGTFPYWLFDTRLGLRTYKSGRFVTSGPAAGDVRGSQPPDWAKNRNYF
jgi:hypothetical protein